jgi:hypothetical protein
MQIEEIAKKAYEDAIKHNPSFLVNSEMVRKKFAELLIFETLNVCSKAAKDNISMDQAVREHFNI